MTRPVFLNVRLSDREYQALSSIAQFEAVTVSEATRMIIRDACKQLGFSAGMVATPEEALGAASLVTGKGSHGQ